MYRLICRGDVFLLALGMCGVRVVEAGLGHLSSLGKPPKQARVSGHSCSAGNEACLTSFFPPCVYSGIPLQLDWVFPVFLPDHLSCRKVWGHFRVRPLSNQVDPDCQGKLYAGKRGSVEKP